MYRILVAGALLACGSSTPQPAPAAPPTHAALTANGQRLVAPSRLEALRVAGDKVITPPTMPTGKIHASFKFCLSETGEVTDVTMIRSSNLPDYDQKIEHEMRRWRFRPYEEDGHAIAVCSAITFVYSAH